MTTGEYCTFFWSNKINWKKNSLDTKSNIAKFYTDSSYANYYSFCKKVEIEYDDPLICEEACGIFDEK